MNDNELFYNLFNGGRYSLPWLLKFSCVGLSSIHLVNNNESIVFNGVTYSAASFEYVEPDSEGAGASLNISAIDNNLQEFIERADENIRLDVVGVIAKDSSIQAIKNYRHLYGSISYSEDRQLQFQLGKDDRLEMTFPPYKFDSDTNRGNT